MSWLASLPLESALPEHCLPQTDALRRFSSTFHTCVPTPLAFVSIALGALSILAWLFAQLPQIYKNWSVGSTSGLSIFFLVEWCLGDLSNLLGALLTHQAPWQVAIAGYYVFVDLCLVGQWVWYEKLKHGHAVFSVWNRRYGRPKDDGSFRDEVEPVISGILVYNEESNLVESEFDSIQGEASAKPSSRSRIITQAAVVEKSEKASASLSGTPSSSTLRRVGSSPPIPSPSPRTILLVACLVTIAQASPVLLSARPFPASYTGSTGLEELGAILSWMSTVLYLGSRLPQLLKNWRRKSTAGLSPHLFIAAFCGNLFYSSALFANPRAWHDFGPHGGGGWVDQHGSRRADWVLAASPFFLGAFGVLGLDGSVGVQFLLYGGSSESLMIVERERGRRRHFKRVSGWLRGWVPSSNHDPKSQLRPNRHVERQVLLPPLSHHPLQHSPREYGAL